jgi:hypothetical protein
MRKLLIVAATASMLGGCGVIYDWDTMQLQSARK